MTTDLPATGKLPAGGPAPAPPARCECEDESHFDIGGRYATSHYFGSEYAVPSLRPGDEPLCVPCATDHTPPTGTGPVPVPPAVRVRLRRAKGWRMPPNTVVVARPSKWGNPWKVVFVRDALAPWGERVEVVRGTVSVRGAAANLPAGGNYRDAASWAVDHYKLYLHQDPVLRAAVTAELAGKSLACWCPLGRPCHADYLLELANPVVAPTGTAALDESPPHLQEHES